MYWMLIGTLCLFTHTTDPSSLQCVRIASDIKFPTYQSCNEFSYKVVEDLQDEITKYDGQGVKFHCVHYELIKMKGQSI